MNSFASPCGLAPLRGRMWLHKPLHICTSDPALLRGIMCLIDQNGPLSQGQ